MKGGFTHGRITIAPLSQDEEEWSSDSSFNTAYSESTMLVPFQNENLAAFVQGKDGSKRVWFSSFH